LGAAAVIACASTTEAITVIVEPKAATSVTPEQAVAGSTVEIVRKDGVLGAGIQVRPGLIATAAHIVGRDSIVTVHDDLGRAQVGTVVGRFGAEDIAFVSIDPDRFDIAVNPLTCNTPPVGLRVEMVGHPYGRLFIRMRADVASTAMPVGQWAKLVILDRRAFPGMSGGPVFSTDGAVVAIVVAATGPAIDGTGPAGAVPGSLVCDVLARL